ncbi:MAG TPA: hypothetical protein VMT25_06820, partial [Thermoanaerobaculia bacterium]|nr:hypothetical protein [Thermoanaerobaculia bacterium]
MLQFAIATLLALQSASGSPNPAPPGTNPQSSTPQGAVPQTQGGAAAPTTDTASESQPAPAATPGRAART